MNLNISNSNTTFKGGFRVANVSPQMKEGFKTLADKGCKVYYNFAKEADALVVAPDSLNNEISTLLKKVYSKTFSYYPNIVPSDSLKLIRKVLGLAQLKPAKNRAISRFDGPMKEKLAILKDIGIEVDTDNTLLKMYKGVVKMHDLTNKRQIIMSPLEKDITYIKILPHSNVEEPQYLEVLKEEFSNTPAHVHRKYKLTPDDILIFTKKFKSTFRNYDDAFMKSSNFARTNLELLAEFAISKEAAEAFFDKAVNEVSELTQKICADEFSVPTFEAFKTIRMATKETQDEMYERYQNWLK